MTDSIEKPSMAEVLESHSETLEPDANVLESESKSSVRLARYGFEGGIFKEPLGILHTEYLSRIYGIQDTW